VEATTFCQGIRMPFTHVVTFKWSDDSFDAQPVAEALRAVVATVSGVRKYTCGSDIGFSPGTFDFVVVGEFDDRESFVSYRDHPEHQRIIKEMITPHLDTRTVVQLED
jgi:hypothetical protein